MTIDAADETLILAVPFPMTHPSATWPANNADAWPPWDSTAHRRTSRYWHSSLREWPLQATVVSADSGNATPREEKPPLEVGAMTSGAIPTSAASESFITDLSHARSRSVVAPTAVGTLVRFRRLDARAVSSNGAVRRFGIRR